MSDASLKAQIDSDIAERKKIYKSKKMRLVTMG